MNDNIKNQVPEKYRADIEKAVQILKQSGCEEIYLFGSLIKDKTREKSDIDLAVRGCKPEHYFQILGELMMELEHLVDLINLDRDDDFAKYLIKEGDMVSVH